MHGLGGDAAYTWGLEFFRRLRASPKSTGYDIYSLSYDSFRPALLSTAELLKIASAICDQPRRVFEASIEADRYHDTPAERGAFSYSDVVFACHSLGALLFRRMVGEAHRQNLAWVDKVRGVLFAPAHRGGRPIPLALEALGSWMGCAARVLQYRLPVLQDLDASSIFVQQTADQTSNLLATMSNRPRASLVCANVAHADRDRVVDIQAPFCADPLPEILYNHTHTSICKVDAERDDALMYLLQALA